MDDPLFQGLLERGLTGRTAKSGFYRGRDEVVTPDFDYRPRQLPEDAALNEKTAQAVMTTASPGGRFAKNTLKLQLIDFPQDCISKSFSAFPYTCSIESITLHYR